jgi:hypothetical protein
MVVPRADIDIDCSGPPRVTTFSTLLQSRIDSLSVALKHAVDA